MSSAPAPESTEPELLVSNNDWLVGGDGNDLVFGGPGDDLIFGDRVSDELMDLLLAEYLPGEQPLSPAI